MVPAYYERLTTAVSLELDAYFKSINVYFAAVAGVHKIIVSVSF